MSTENETVNFFAAHEAFAVTEFGQALSNQIRFKDYKPNEVSNDRWKELLGADVNNLDHMLLSYNLTRVMINALRQDHPGLLIKEEEDQLLMAAVIHDQAEAVVGDLNYTKKTQAFVEEEMRQLHTMLDVVYGGEESSEYKELVYEAAEIVNNPDTKLGLIFNTVEAVGYLRTALRGSGHVIDGTAKDCEEGLRLMTSSVLAIHIPRLVLRSDLYAPVKTYLVNQAESISRAYSIVSNEVFNSYDNSERFLKLDSFSNSQRVWTNWLESLR
jgi:hypothetical protein